MILNDLILNDLQESFPGRTRKVSPWHEIFIFSKLFKLAQFLGCTLSLVDLNDFAFRVLLTLLLSEASLWRMKSSAGIKSVKAPDLILFQNSIMQYERILLIDDDEEDHEIFMAALGHISDEFQCITYSDASEALGKLQNTEITADVIFLDLNMPIMSGQEFLRRIKKEDSIRGIPVIVFSTSSNPATIQQAKELGAINFITKPDRLDKLVNILKPILM